MKKFIVTENGPKFDLKPGMLVEVRNGKRYIVVPFHAYGGDSALCGIEMGRSNWCSNIMSIFEKDGWARATKVGWPSKLNSQAIAEFDNSLDIWEISYESDIKELTLDEIAAKFGVSVDQIRIKD